MIQAPVKRVQVTQTFKSNKLLVLGGQAFGENRVALASVPHGGDIPAEDGVAVNSQFELRPVAVKELNLSLTQQRKGFGVKSIPANAALVETSNDVVDIRLEQRGDNQQRFFCRHHP